MSTERVIIQRGAADTFITELSAIFKVAKAGDFLNDKSATLGALFSEPSAENVVSLLKEAAEAGAKILVGDMQRQGTVVQPHIVTDVKPCMRIWDRESFGPGELQFAVLISEIWLSGDIVVIVAVVDTVEEAVELANCSDYSLMAGLWTRDIYNAFGVSEKLRSGTS